MGMYAYSRGFNGSTSDDGRGLRYSIQALSDWHVRIWARLA